MPELPEVEATRRHIAPTLQGARIVDVRVRRDRMVRLHERPADFAERAAGRRVISVGRHGKLLKTALSGDMTWITHLGMSGRLAVHGTGEPEQPHTNVVIGLEGGWEIRMIDPRTFGFVAVLTPDEAATGYGSGWGPDAFDDLPSARALAVSFEGRTASVKALLLDQRIIAGLGNIYADEILYRAGVRPDRPAGSLAQEEVARLRRAVRPVLASALRHGGTSLDDLAYLLPDGRAGDNLARLAVYGRDGLPCRRCGTVIARSMIRARSTHWCPECQA